MSADEKVKETKTGTGMKTEKNALKFLKNLYPDWYVVRALKPLQVNDDIDFICYQSKEDAELDCKITEIPKVNKYGSPQFSRKGHRLMTKKIEYVAPMLRLLTISLKEQHKVHGFDTVCMELYESSKKHFRNSPDFYDFKITKDGDTRPSWLLKGKADVMLIITHDEFRFYEYQEMKQNVFKLLGFTTDFYNDRESKKELVYPVNWDEPPKTRRERQPSIHRQWETWTGKDTQEQVRDCGRTYIAAYITNIKLPKIDKHLRPESFTLDDVDTGKDGIFEYLTDKWTEFQSSQDINFATKHYYRLPDYKDS